MLASSKKHWATLLAVGLPLLVGGCAGGGMSNPHAEAPPRQARAATDVNALALAERLKAEGNVSSAASMYQQAHQANPGDIRPLLGLGETYMGMGANAEAAEAYGAALAIQPSNLDALRGLGHARIMLGQPQFAITQYQLAVQIAPKDVRALNGLGVAQDMAGDHKAAQQSYRSVLAIEPSNQSAKNNMALSLALSGDNEAAIRMLEDISKSSGASAVNRQNLALVYGVSGKMDESAKVGRADLPDDVVRRNIAALNANSDPTARQEMLKQSLGVELKGRQYTPAAQPSAPLNNLAQIAVDEQPAYMPMENNGGDLPLITTGKTQGTASVATPQDVVLKPSTGDDWSDDWDEELVDATDADAAAPSPLTAAADEPLPATPAQTETEKPASPFLPSTAEAAAKPAAASADSEAGATQVAATMPATAAPATAEPAAATANDAAADASATQEPKVRTAEATRSAAMPATDAAVTEPPAMTVKASDLGGAKVYTVQIASYRSETEATAGWQTLTAELSDLLAGLPHSVNKTDLGVEKGIYYRLQAGSFPSRDDAKALCSGLKSRSIDCMVVESAAAQPQTPDRTQQSMLVSEQSFVVGAR